MRQLRHAGSDQGGRDVVLIDLPVFGRQARLVWRKHRWTCPEQSCSVRSWTSEDPRIAAPRLAMTDRAGRWVTEQVGRCGRTVNEVAGELGCDWHTVNDAVMAYGTALVDDPERIGETTALGLDETLFCRLGRWRAQQWSTSIVDVGACRLLDVVAGRDSTNPCQWLGARDQAWLDRIEWATLDLSGPYRAVFDTMLPDAVQVADPPRGQGAPRAPCGASAPRGAMCSGAGERPATPACRSRSVKLRAA